MAPNVASFKRMITSKKASSEKKELTYVKIFNEMQNNFKC